MVDIRYYFVAAVLTSVARLRRCDDELLQLQTLRYQLEVSHRRSLVDGACGFKIDHSKGVDHGEVVAGWHFDCRQIRLACVLSEATAST